MDRFRISVYAIAKNEEKFAARWAQSMSEADDIIVLDTGSEDRTVEILSSFPKVTVYSEKIHPWRFDTARNKSLEKVPADTDYCICTDIDEVFEKGWRDKLEKALVSRPHKVSYRYTWSFNPDGSENTVFNIEKTHRRHGFSWTHPVHEGLSYQGKDAPITIFAEGVQLNHLPDKEKSRKQYLPLLELSVKEAPEDDRNMHYLGREYMYYGRYEEAISVLEKHLSLRTALWKDERCASMRYIAKCLEATGRKNEAFLRLLSACAEAPYIREPWMDTAEFLYREKNWHGVITFINKALEITELRNTYITNTENHRDKPYDLLSVAYYYIGDKKNAEENAKKALEFSPDNERIKANLKLYIS